MADSIKIPWRKHLDPRYISGEDLLAEQHGLKREMVVTLAKYEDVATIDQKTFAETQKTGLWLKLYPSGPVLYKPMILNVTNGKFLSKEIGNNSIWITDFGLNKPFVMFAQPDSRHGHVVRLKKYYPPTAVTDTNAIAKLNAAEKTSEALNAVWGELSAEEKKLPSVLAIKEKLRGGLK